MKKLGKLTLKELGESVKVLDPEHVSRLKGGDGSDYPYYCPGEVYCSDKAPGYLASLSELSGYASSYNERSDVFAFGASLLTPGSFKSNLLGLLSLGVGVAAINFDGKADRINEAVKSLENMGYNESSILRLDLKDFGISGLSEPNYVMFVWDGVTGEKLTEIPIGN